MGLNPRIWIVCSNCLGRPDPHELGLELCDACAGTGRDAATEARLAELAGRLQTAAIMVLSYATAACTDEVARIRHGMVSDLDALAALLLTAGQPGAEPASKGA